ncbi:MAG: BolA family transcriptional regulator [Actinobacteria bacterium]|nr:BolA family transcriptional regulator [Actinomycetota bacterium]
MSKVEEIKQRIEQSLPGSVAEVEDTVGDDNHFRAVVTAAQFAGRTRIEQHRMINEIFAGELGGRIHALSIKTQTPDATVAEGAG